MRSGLSTSYESMQMKGLTEKNLEKIFMVHMGEFYGNKDIHLMEKNEIDDFIRLLKNLRGGITHIVKWHA